MASELKEGPVKNIIDGDKTTFWHSKYEDGGNGGHDERGGNEEAPLQFTVNLGKETTFKGFSYMPRTDSSQNGRFQHYEFYVANTEEELNMKIQNNYFAAKGDISKSSSSSTLVIFDTPLTGQYAALRSLNHDKYSTCAEFNLYSDPEAKPPIFISTTIDESSDTFWVPNKMSRSGWTALANSQQSTQSVQDGCASNILNTDRGKFWHSRYDSSGDKGHDDRPTEDEPLRVTINLRSKKTFKAFSYMPRPDSESGRFSHYDFYVAQTPEELYMKIRDNKYAAKGDIVRSSALSTLVIFSVPITGQYVAIRSLNGEKNLQHFVNSIFIMILLFQVMKYRILIKTLRIQLTLLKFKQVKIMFIKFLVVDL